MKHSQLHHEVDLLRWLLGGIRYLPDARQIVEYLDGMLTRREVALLKEEAAERANEDRQFEAKLGWRPNTD